jgi:hypothetical protein
VKLTGSASACNEVTNETEEQNKTSKKLKTESYLAERRKSWKCKLRVKKSREVVSTCGFTSALKVYEDLLAFYLKGL